MNKMKLNTKTIVLYALGIACVFIATMFIKIPNGKEGYFNLGDGFIFLFSSIASPLGGFIIGGVSSALADVAGGYAYFFFPTLIIKGLEGLTVAILFKKYGTQIKYLAFTLGSLIMVTGYFIAECFMHENVAIALSGIPANILQGVVGIIIGILVFPVIQNQMKKFIK